MITLDISKAFDRFWHKALIYKLPSFGFYPSLCSFISNFFSDRSIGAVVDGHCSFLKLINSDVPQGSITHSFPIIHQWLSQSYSVSYPPICWWLYLALLQVFLKTPKPETGINDSRGNATERLTFNFSSIWDWARENLVLFNASKTQFLHLFIRQNLPDNCLPLYTEHPWAIFY